MEAVLTAPKIVPQILFWTLKLQLTPAVDVIKLVQLASVGVIKTQLPQFLDVKLYWREGQLYPIRLQLKITLFLSMTANVVSGGGGGAVIFN